MSRWFRHYAGMMRDPKFVAVAVRAKQPVERVLFVWGCILESAAERNNGGSFDLDAGELAYFLRCDEAEIVGLLSAFETTGLIAEGSITKWKERQFESDHDPTGAERQRRYRKRHSQEQNEPVTDASRVTNAPHRHSTETDTDTEKKEDIGPRAGRAEKSDWPKDFEDQFWKAFPRKTKKGASLRKLDAIRKSGRVTWSVLLPAVKLYAANVSGKDPQFVMHPLTWLNAGCWDDELPAPTQVFSGPVDAPGLVHVMREADEWPTWAALYRRHKGKDPPVNKDGGWHFPAEWANDTTTEAAA